MFLSGALESKQEAIEMATWHERLQEHLFEVQLQAQLEKAKNVLELLRNDGLFVKRRGEKIAVSPANKLTEQHRELIRETKPSLIAVLVIEEKTKRR